MIRLNGLESEIMISEKEYEKLWDGILVDYIFFGNVMFHGETKDGKHVFIKDKFGNEKKICKSLFLKYASIHGE